MKNKTLLKSIICAFRGLIYTLKTEKNYKYYFFIVFVCVILNIFIKVNIKDYMFIIIPAFGVFSSECLNTSIEHLSNFINKEINSEIKIIKDIAAGSVLFWGICFFVCEFILIGEKIL